MAALPRLLVVAAVLLSAARGTGAPPDGGGSPLGGSTFERLLSLHSLRGFGEDGPASLGPTALTANFSRPILEVLGVLSKISTRLAGSQQALAARQMNISTHCKAEVAGQRGKIAQWQARRKNFTTVADIIAAKLTVAKTNAKLAAGQAKGGAGILEAILAKGPVSQENASGSGSGSGTGNLCAGGTRHPRQGAGGPC